MRAVVFEDVMVCKQEQTVLRVIDDSWADVDERTVVAIFTKDELEVFPCAALVFAAERTVITDEDDGSVACCSNRVQMQLVAERAVVVGIELVTVRQRH